ncbi:hypothetical protein ACFPRL_09830 [Pseudoclavibacter helvolus]
MSSRRTLPLRSQRTPLASVNAMECTRHSGRFVIGWIVPLM